jgi:hypothetical protein
MAAPSLLSRAVPPPAAVEPATRPVGLALVLSHLGIHLVLGVLGLFSPMVATAHAAVTALALLGSALWGRDLGRLVLLTAYASLCDVYWRMTGSRAPWEFSKYLLVLGSVAVLIRYARPWRRPGQPLVFLALLVPGMAALLVSQGIGGVSRDALSSVEMGLVALALASLAFRQVVATEADAWNLGWVILGPVVATLGITTWASLTTADLEFTDESNFNVTAGFGPNQVSVILGLGILVCALLAYQRRGSRFLGVLVGLGLWLTWAAFLTFSRGGVYSLVIAGGALVLVGVATRGARVRSVATAVVGVVGLMLMFAMVNDFTGNWLDTRYDRSGSATTGRSDLAEQDLAVWGEHPLLGVGTAQSIYHHTGGNLSRASTHTEYTRLVAEHGLFGLAAIGVLVAMFVSGLRQARSQWNRLLVAGAGVWALTTMLHASTRLAAVSLLFALTQLRVDPDPVRLAAVRVRRRFGGTEAVRGSGSTPAG